MHYTSLIVKNDHKKQNGPQTSIITKRNIDSKQAKLSCIQKTNDEKTPLPPRTLITKTAFDHYSSPFQIGLGGILFFNTLQEVTRVEDNVLILQNFTYTNMFSLLVHPLRKHKQNWSSKLKTHSSSKPNYLPFPTRSSTLETYEEVDSS